MSNHKTNILYTSSFGSLKGGGQRSLLLLLQCLDRQKFNPFLMVPEEDDLAQEARKFGVQTFVLAFPRVSSLHLFSTLAGLVTLRKIIKACRIDIVHTDAPRDTIYAALAGVFLNTRIVFHARVYDHFYWLDRLIYCFSDAIIAVSRSVAERFRTFDKKNKVRVVYNGVALDIFKPLPDYGSDTARPLSFGYFGAVARRKGIEVFVKAVKRIGGGLEVVIMGDCEPLYLQEIKNLSGASGIIFKDYRQDIVQDIRKADTIVLPSIKEEGLPRLLIEGMAMGKIVIASDVSAHKEILGDDLKEFIFSVGDDKGLTTIIERIMANRNILAEKKEIIRKKAEQLFDIKQKTQEIENTYNSLLKTKE
jgi:glycosyltransferase involved in cell wall biosynthesis